jgi:hypothetical protein
MRAAVPHAAPPRRHRAGAAAMALIEPVTWREVPWGWLVIATLLTAFGVAFVISACYDPAERLGLGKEARMQLVWWGISLAACIGVLHVPFATWRALAIPAFVAGIAARAVHGRRRRHRAGAGDQGPGQLGGPRAAAPAAGGIHQAGRPARLRPPAGQPGFPAHPPAPRVRAPSRSPPCPPPCMRATTSAARSPSRR